jgi:hypothetical protein
MNNDPECESGEVHAHLEDPHRERITKGEFIGTLKLDLWLFDL